VTSLVAILNDQAVALAADSAVTTEGPSGQKIYNTVNKLFTLSKQHPVGIMVYSSAEIMGVPIETVIKVYRDQRGNDKKDTLEEYYTAFISFLENDTVLFPYEARLRHCENMISGVFFNLLNQILRHLDRAYTGWGQPTQTQAKQVAQLFLEQQISRFQHSNELSGVDGSVRTKLKNKLKPHINRWKEKLKADFALSNATLALLTEHCLDLVLREEHTGVETGFVIAGFGDKEFLPQLRSFEFESSVEGIHKIGRKAVRDVSVEGASVTPFAQREMVDTFMQGRSAKLDSFSLRLFDQFFSEKTQEAANDPSLASRLTEITSTLEDLRLGLRTRFIDELKSFTGLNHIKPVLETLGVMPKEELALLAEALVNLQIIKRHASPDADTVGGPTDVAVISKGDGFIWMKRKHYFRPELNPHFSRNYFGGNP